MKNNRKLRRKSNPYWDGIQRARLLKRRELLMKQYERLFGKWTG